MSTANNIFGSEFIRAGTVTEISERVTIDPRVLAEVAFRDANGMSRADYVRRNEQLREDEAKADALRSLQGEPPEFEVRKLSPQRTRYARYSLWLLQSRKERAALEARKAEFEAMIAAPAATQAEIRGLIRQAADRLMGRGKGDVSAEVRKRLGDTLAEEKLAADAAGEALPELERQIEIAQMRVHHLAQREDEFLKPAIIEAAEDMGLGQLYMDRLRAFREVVDLVSGLARIAGGFGSGFSGMSASVHGQYGSVSVEAVNMPQLGFKSVSKNLHNYTLHSKSQSDAWRQLRQALILDPYVRADHVVALPKG